MKLHTLRTWKAALLGLACLMAYSCDDDNEANSQLADAKTATSEYQAAQAEMDQAASAADNAMRAAGLGGRTAGVLADVYCAAFSHDRDANTITLDFGTSGCTGPDGRLRKGLITIVYTGELDVLGSNARSVTFSNYSVDGYALDGVMTSTRWQLSNGKLTSTLTAIGMELAYPDGTDISWNGTWTRTLELNMEDFAASSYTLSGESAGTTRGGHAFVSNTTSPVAFQLSCWLQGIPYAVSGGHRLQVASTIPVVATIDYGNGACDRLVTLSVNGSSVEYELP
jgi:hypothetical protein